MAITGKTGADALYNYAKGQCRIIAKYGGKFDALITALVGTGALTSAEAVTLRAFVAAQSAVCDLLKITADNTNVNN